MKINKIFMAIFEIWKKCHFFLISTNKQNDYMNLFFIFIYFLLQSKVFVKTRGCSKNNSWKLCLATYCLVIRHRGFFKINYFIVFQISTCAQCQFPDCLLLLLTWRATAACTAALGEANRRKAFWAMKGLILQPAFTWINFFALNICLWNMQVCLNQSSLATLRIPKWKCWQLGTGTNCFTATFVTLPEVRPRFSTTNMDNPTFLIKKCLWSNKCSVLVFGNVAAKTDHMSAVVLNLVD